MDINRTRLLPYRLPLRQLWRTCHGVLRERSGWITELTTDDGMTGFGDCAPLPAIGTETADDAQRWLRRHLSQLAGVAPQEALENLPEHCPAPAARCALETALLDLISQAAGRSLRHWLSPRAAEAIGVNASAGSLDEESSKRSRALAEQGFRTLKFKVGIFPVELELARLHQLDSQLSAAIRVRLDANAAWKFDTARRFLAELPLRVESVEEPLQNAGMEQLAALQDMTHAALALDESLPSMDLELLLQKPPVKRLILKPSVLGGLLPALALAGQAAEAGMQSLVTGTLESAVGIRAASQLAAAIPQAEPLDHGLATGSWLAVDVAQSPEIIQGQMMLPGITGLGIRKPLHTPAATG